MDAQRFDGLATKVSEISSRRHVLKWLGGSVAAGLVAVAGHDVADAKRKKKKKQKPQPQQQTCAPGTSVGSVTVPPTGATVNTPNLTQGQRYRLRATGFWSSNATHGQDAFADFELANPNVVVTTFQGVRLGLSVNGGSADQWGSYNVNHTYEQQVTGTGGSLTLRMSDVVFTDNSGSVTVDAFCA
jgi:hypothetical protein